jgi:hypothetical protein
VARFTDDVVLHKPNLPGFVTAMAWEERGRGGRYYYRSVRDGGRVRKEYLGTGKIAEILARSDELIRRQRAEELDRERAEVERLDTLAAPVVALDEAASVLVRAELVAAGYHKYKGEWRLRRGRNT